MPLPRALARFNRIVTNPVQRVWAGRLPGFVIVEHVGRKSGRRYRTPVNGRREPDGFAIALTYGAETDWVRNVLAAGGGDVVYRGARIEVTSPTVETGPNVLAAWPAVVRLVLRRLGVDKVMHLTAVELPAAPLPGTQLPGPRKSGLPPKSSRSCELPDGRLRGCEPGVAAE